MEIGRTIYGSALRRVIKGLFFSAMFALPWINQIRISTFLFIITACLLLVSGFFFTDYTWYKKQLLFWLFIMYYLLQVIAFCLFPHDAYARADLDRKASFIVIPLLLYIMVTIDKYDWKDSIKWFIYGNAFAAIYCLVWSLIKFGASKDINVFFYHQYSQPIKLNAIYFSLYILVALGYIVLNNFQGRSSSRQSLAMGGIGLFLFLNLLLLSSKMMIVAGMILLIILINATFKSTVLKIVSLGVIIIASLVIVFSNNPVKARYMEVNFRNYSALYNENNFKDFPFDGLSLRLVLWRLGYELINEKKMWFFGAGGERYHEWLNPKIIQYQLYSGNGTEADVGYQNYNMHNQYMETFLQFGVTGVIFLVTVLIYTLWYAVSYHQYILIYCLILFSLAFLTESLLETQSGILLFTIIISGEWIQLRKKMQAKLS